MNKIKLITIDLFFIVGSIIGVGFATGEEISHYFTSGKSIVFAVMIFFIVFTSLSIYIINIKTSLYTS